jgi:hypothetical protein
MPALEGLIDFNQHQRLTRLEIKKMLDSAGLVGDLDWLELKGSGALVKIGTVLTYSPSFEGSLGRDRIGKVQRLLDLSVFDAFLGSFLPLHANLKALKGKFGQGHFSRYSFQEKSLVRCANKIYSYSRGIDRIN